MQAYVSEFDEDSDSRSIPDRGGAASPGNDSPTGKDDINNHMRTGWEDVNREWGNLSTWAQLIKKNIDYVYRSENGDEDVASPYSAGPLDPEQCPLIPGMLNLHRYGLFIFQSNPSVPFVKFHPRKNEWYEAEQYPFVEFLLPYEGEATESFTNGLLSDPQLKAKIWDRRSGVAKAWPGSCSEEIIITLYKKAATEDDLPRASWKVNASIMEGIHDIQEECEGIAEVKVVKDKQPLWYMVGSPNHIDLLGSIEKIAAHAGLKAKYDLD
ncbi:hypothetical protein K4F52_004126 [Lecanicillium sp. MT-2017a]|nr:hypothetical protein K4F52_004126 [Lecanicillium sp. MT-2017a]